MSLFFSRQIYVLAQQVYLFFPCGSPSSFPYFSSLALFVNNALFIFTFSRQIFADFHRSSFCFFFVHFYPLSWFCICCISLSSAFLAFFLQLFHGWRSSVPPPPLAVSSCVSLQRISQPFLTGYSSLSLHSPRLLFFCSFFFLGELHLFLHSFTLLADIVHFSL